MADQILDLSALPDANPATAPAEWRLISGSDTGLRVRNGVGLLSIGNLWGGWEYASPLVASSNTISASCSYKQYVNSDGRIAVTLLGATGGYRFRIETFNIFIDKIDGNLAGASTQLANLSVERFVDDEYLFTYNISTGLLTAYINDVSVHTATDATYAAETFYGGGAIKGFDRAAVSSISVFNVAAAATVTIATDLTPDAARTDTCVGYADGAATVSF